MGLFNSKKEGGIMDVIRSHEKNEGSNEKNKDYLIWKWSPGGIPSRRESEIRYGSTLFVKDTEVAVFVYRQKDGTMQDFIEGPHDSVIKTANFPVLASIVGLAFGGAAPFPAEIYFINMAGNIKLPFKIWEGFDVADPRFLDYTVPVTVKGSITFHITDYRHFIKLNRMASFDLDDFSNSVKDAVTRYTKGIVSNAPAQLGMPLVQIERGIEAINGLVEEKVKEALMADFGVTASRVDLSEIKLDRESEDFRKLQAITSDLQTDTLQAQNKINIRNMADMQAINAANAEESLRVMREETQRQQRLQTESAHLTAHQINVQGDVAKTAAESIGQLGSNPGAGMGDGGGGGGMNPAAMMTGMMLGGAVGGNMASMLGNMTQGLNQPQPPPPPPAALASWYFSVNGSQSGPYTPEQLRGMVAGGQLTPATYVWKAGMGSWAPAADVPEVNGLFPPPPPPPPPPAPVPPPPAAPV